jgi:hypothetical protein
MVLEPMTNQPLDLPRRATCRDRLRRVGLMSLTLLAAPLFGCQAMAMPFLLWGPEPTKKVPAEYADLAGKKVAILVWADMDVLFEYQHVQLEVSEHVRAGLEGKVKGATFVPSRQVVELQRQDPDWDRADPAKLGTKLGAERVLLVELTQYTTREPDSPHLLRGHIGANIKVYDTAQPGSLPVYKGVAEAAYPEHAVAQWGANDTVVRRGAMEEFAQVLAGRFYDRQIKVK